MKRIFALSLIVLTTAISSCKQETCPVSCGNGIIHFVAVGFTRAELNGAGYIMAYGGGKEIDTMYFTNLSHPGTDTTSDTLATLFIDGPNKMPVKVFVPLTNSTYNIDNFKYSGNLTEQVDCFEGGKYGSTPVGPACGVLYLQSYYVNGVMINMLRPDSTGAILGLIYFHK